MTTITFWSAARVALTALVPFVLLYGLFGLLERRFPAHPLKPARGWVFNIVLSLAYLAVPLLTGGAVAALIAVVRGINGGGLVDLDIAGDAGLPARIAAALAFMLIFDFFYYWWHRMQHEVAALWAIHKLHHMDETLGVSTDMRHHWLEEIGRTVTIVLPMALIFNLTPQAGRITTIAFTAWTAFIHSNLRLGLGRIGVIVAGPQVHRIHHSRLPHHFDRNYAALFPFYDVLFGTYYHPAHDEFPPTGVIVDPETGSFRQALLLPFQTWRATIRSRRDVSADATR